MQAQHRTKWVFELHLKKDLYILAEHIWNKHSFNCLSLLLLKNFIYIQYRKLTKLQQNIWSVSDLSFCYFVTLKRLSNKPGPKIVAV